MVVLSYLAGVFQPSGVPGESQLVLTDGWMDGWVGKYLFFSAYCTKTTSYLTLIVLMPPRRSFLDFFCAGNRPFLNPDFFVLTAGR